MCVCVFCHFYFEIRQTLSFHHLLRGNFQYLSFRDIIKKIKKYEKDLLEIQHPNSENSRLDFIESVRER